MMRWMGPLATSTLFLACGQREQGFTSDARDASSPAPLPPDASLLVDAPGFGDSGTCAKSCSEDGRSVVDCAGREMSRCNGIDACDPSTLSCRNACAVAADTKQSVGCEYFPAYLAGGLGQEGCFAAFVANTWDTAATISLKVAGRTPNLAMVGKIPVGAGPSLTYRDYDPVRGLPPGEVLILFLSGEGKGGNTRARCPVDGTATSSGVYSSQTGKLAAFQITSNVPVVSYQMNPYGGGNAAVTGASLLLPTSAWDKDYVVATAYSLDSDLTNIHPSVSVVAKEPDTHVTFTPRVPLQGGGGLPGGPAGSPAQFVLQAGEHAQFLQADELSGSLLQSDKPLGVFAGHPCMRVPNRTRYCDHGEQMLPPVRALGSKYVGVRHKPRKDEPAVYRILGTENGTQLSWSQNVGGPSTLSKGQIVEFSTRVPFVVESQDSAHPFLLLSYMMSNHAQRDLYGDGDPGNEPGYGDADVVLVVPPEQYMKRYVFFADPTYPETSLVVIRAKQNGAFADVTLDCLGKVSGFMPVGDYEFAYVDLTRGFSPVGQCSTGRHEMKSNAPFGLWVWGWGTPETGTSDVSYGYPAGMNVRPINQVVVPPPPPPPK